MPAKKPVRAVTPEPPKTPARLTPPFGRTPTLIIAACVMAGGILLAARQQTQPLLSTTPTQDVVPAPEVRASRVMTANAPSATSTGGSSSAAKAVPVTITGCVERDNDTFRLKDTAGADAPKSRSWKSGFLKKGQAKIELVDAAHAANLASQVGRRVSVTGMLGDREMQVRSVRRVAASCDAK